jgi:general secretion pathway protein E
MASSQYPSLERRIGWILVQQAGLSEKDLEEVLRASDVGERKIGEILVERKLVKPEDIAKALAFQLGMPFVEDLKPNDIDPKVINGLQIQFCREHSLLPIYRDERLVRVAVSDPFHYEPIDALKLLFRQDIDLVIATPQKLEEAINRVFERSENLIKGLEAQAEDYADLDETADLLEAGDDEAPVIRFVNSLLVRAVKEKASDIHIEPFERFVTVRFRVDGIMNDVYQAPKALAAAIASRIKVLGELNIAEKRIPQDGRIKINIAGREVDIRLSTVPVAFGERIVMRLLDKSSVVLDFKQLGFNDHYIKTIGELTNRKYGIFLVTGPTGSGKSTTLSTCLKSINSPERNIITVEDPVEFVIPGVGQIAVNSKVGLTFAAGLRAILRQDPDVVMVGEIRDRETAEIAINASLTGHLVLSTLHTNDAPGAITRIVDMGVEPFLVSSSLVGVLAQRLIRTLCSSCSEEWEPSDEVLAPAGLSRQALKETYGTVTIKRPKGCNECRFSGYRGRTAIHELMVITDSIRQMILNRLDSSTIRKQASAEGLKTLRESAIEKLVTGKTSFEEILRMTQLET